MKNQNRGDWSVTDGTVWFRTEWFSRRMFDLVAVWVVWFKTRLISRNCLAWYLLRVRTSRAFVSV